MLVITVVKFSSAFHICLSIIEILNSQKWASPSFCSHCSVLRLLCLYNSFTKSMETTVNGSTMLNCAPQLWCFINVKAVCSFKDWLTRNSQQVENLYRMQRRKSSSKWNSVICSMLRKRELAPNKQCSWESHRQLCFETDLIHRETSETS